MIFTRLSATVLVFLLVNGSLPTITLPALAATESKAESRRDDSQKEKKGLQFRLSEGSDRRKPETTTSATTTATVLSTAETDRILKRLPELKVANADETFALRDRSLPPPRAGKTINISFPGDRTEPPAEVESATLQVLRAAPQGNVAVAPNLSVTFSQPMAPIGSLEEAAANVPVKLSPQPSGKWRWVGTKTVVFEPEGAFPMATDYSVTVPAATRSASGSSLAAGKSWNFATPPPTVIRTSPPTRETQTRDPLMFVEFDQRIDPEAVLKTIKIRAGAFSSSARLAGNDEIRAHDDTRQLVAKAVPGRWLAFRAENPNPEHSPGVLPAGARVLVTIGPGTPSAEGPKRTSKAQTFSFPIYGALRVTGHECEDSKRCHRTDSINIEFTNSLDESSFHDSLVRIEPAIEKMETSISGSTLTIGGDKRAGTVYRVFLDPRIKDEFGQSLGASPPVSVYVERTRPVLSAREKSFAVLNPFGAAAFSVYTVNYKSLKVRLYSVTAEDYPQWLEYQDPRSTKKQARPGRLVLSRTILLDPKPEEIVETPIDVGPALTDGHGQMILVVESPERRIGAGYTIEVWLQRTDIGLDAFVDKTQLVGWASSLKNGSPLANVDLQLLPYGSRQSTAADGIARLPLAAQEIKKASYLVARQGTDVAILTQGTEGWRQPESWFRKPAIDYLHWFVFDDRKIYRPGEEVHIKGWMRRLGGDPFGDVGSLGSTNTTTDVVFTVKDSRGVDILRGGAPIGLLGGFDFSFPLPQTMNLGDAQISLLTNSSLAGSSFTHSFLVQEFRRPEFEVEAQVDSNPPHFIGAAADLSVAAKYYSGGGLADAPIKWEVNSSPTQFTPPNRSDFTFGKWRPWWGSDYDATQRSQSNTKVLTGRTDQDGKHRLHVDFDSVDPARPSLLLAEASVTDLNRQTWTSKTTLLVHPADLYVGLRSKKTFVQQGQPLVVETIVTNIDGAAIPQREIKMHAALLEWQKVSDEWIQAEKNPQDCSIFSNSSAATCKFETPDSGEYRVLAQIRDQRGRANESELTLWVAGDKAASEADYSVQALKLIPDKQEYHGGDTAEILVQGHLYPAEGMVTLLRSGVLKTQAFHVDGPTHTLRIPIEASWTPNIILQVNLAGNLERGLGREAAYASGELSLSIPPLDRKLQVTATARDKTLEPGAETEIHVDVKNAQGGPVNGSEVAVLAVDESVLALTNYELADPLTAFYALRQQDTSHYRLREQILSPTPREERERFITHYWSRSGGYGYGGGATGLFRRAERYVDVGRLPLNRRYLSFALIMPGSVSPVEVGSVNASLRMVTKSGSDPEVESSQIRLRENFNALAVFAPAVKTDANGHATVRVKLPDNLTRYRVMAVAVAGGKYFGSGESDLTAQMSVMVRPSAPRFLNVGDRFELPIVIQNQTSQPVIAEVAVRAVNALFGESTVTGGSDQAGRRVNVAANDRVEIRLPATTVRPGLAHFQLSVVSGSWSDAASATFPVWTPATTESFATYGELDEGAVSQTISAPRNVFKEFGGLEIETSSTQLQQLTDAVLYLTHYPYECSEQLSSRIIGIAALRDVLSSFKSQDMPAPAELEAVVAQDLKRLQGMQNRDGGFGFWKQGDESWPYLTIHVAHALARAKQKKFMVATSMIENVSGYLKNIESNIPARYGRNARRALTAYALYARAQLGDRDPASARRLIAATGLESLSMESAGWLLSVLAGDKSSQAQLALIRRHLNNHVTETASTAHFVSDYDDGNYLLLNSDSRTDAVLLEGLIADQKTNDLIPKLVRGLLEHRTRGRWQNTQENAFVLLALDRYFSTYEKVSPNFVARIWLGDAYAGQQEFHGRAIDRQNLNVPMSYLVKTPAQQKLTLSKEGSGRLYYRISMSYAPADWNLRAVDSGFTVQREYESIDHPDDVRRDAEGRWKIKAGARVRVRLTMFAPAERYHVALTDPLAGGFETLNPVLATTQNVSEDATAADAESYRQLHWFDRQNLRDERTEAFTTRLWPGVYKYSYVARATTPGDFIVPPVKVEEMYHPETFARGKTDRVQIQ
jgi:alpha-2-macroglobulin